MLEIAEELIEVRFLKIIHENLKKNIHENFYEGFVPILWFKRKKLKISPSTDF